MRIPCTVVLFDSDGVLVDSDASVARAWRRWATEYDVQHPDVVSLVHGRRSADTVQMLVDAVHRERALATINRYEVEDARFVSAIAGAATLICSIPADRFAVVTSARRELVLARLAAAGLKHPVALISAEDVTRGKPDPAGYLAAATALKEPAQTTVVIEDSPSGIAAARAADVGAVIGVSSRALETDADIVVRDLTSVTWTPGALLVDGTRALRVTRALRRAAERM